MNQFNRKEKGHSSRNLYGKYRAFGSGSSALLLNRWERTWKTPMTNVVSLLVLAGSKTAEIEGISAAGSTKESSRSTAVAEAQLL